MRDIPGDPLTGSIPATRVLIMPRAVQGPTRRRPLDPWPRTADPAAVTYSRMHTGMIAYVRTRRGIRRWQIRTVNRSTWRRHRGRHYFTGHDRHGLCHSAWVDQVIRVESVQRALTRRSVIDVRSE